MKKIFSLILILCFLFVLCSCKNNEQADTSHDNNTDTTVQSTTQSTAEPTATESAPATQVTSPETDAPMDKVDADGHYKQNHIKKIDVPCADEINKAQSDAVKKTIYDKYAEEWTKVADRYFKELKNTRGTVPATENYNTAEQMCEYLEFYKLECENNLAQQCQVFTNQMIEGTDNVGLDLMLAQLTYESKREMALYFIGVYEDLEAFSNAGN